MVLQPGRVHVGVTTIGPKAPAQQRRLAPLMLSLRWAPPLAKAQNLNRKRA